MEKMDDTSSNGIRFNSERGLRNAINNNPSILALSAMCRQLEKEQRELQSKENIVKLTEEKQTTEAFKMELENTNKIKENNVHSMENTIRATKQSQFLCGICDKEWSCRSALELHVFTHSKEKRFTCSVCHKKYAREKSLKKHMYSHTGEVKYI